MNDFLKILFLGIAVMLLAYGAGQLDLRLTVLEEAVYNRPLGNCVEMQDLLKNRQHPPAHGVHSYAKPVPVCGEQP